MKVLITGACGFIGHHVVEGLIKGTDLEIVCWDKLTYAANGFNRFRDLGYLGNPRIKTFTADFCQKISHGIAEEIGEPDYILHLGAETHVDNSIIDAEPFVMSNVIGTMHILEYARTLKNLRRMVYFSTDEVFGPAPEGVYFKEWDRYKSSNPYAASKAGGEELCVAYQNTHKVPVFITHTMNAFGERQHHEKFIPKVVRSLIKDELITLHSNADRTKGSIRSWVHARNIAHALIFLLDRGVPGEKYNIVGEKEVDVYELMMFIAKVIGKQPKYQMVDFHSSRPGHDYRYALDGSLLKGMGFEYPKTFEESLEKTIQWSLQNPKWLGMENAHTL